MVWKDRLTGMSPEFDSDVHVAVALDTSNW